jgi:hypothetical protein
MGDVTAADIDRELTSCLAAVDQSRSALHHLQTAAVLEISKGLQQLEAAEARIRHLRGRIQ